MKTLPPAAPPSVFDITTSSAKGRWRWIRWLSAILGGILVVGIFTAAALVLNYQPLRGGPTQWPPPTGIGAVAIPEHWLAPSGFQLLPQGAERLRVRAPQGLTFRYRYSFYNRGSVPVTVTSIGFSAADQRESGATRTVAAIDVGGTGWQAFRPFTLEGRQTVSVESVVHVTACWRPGDMTEWNSDRVEFNVFGIHRTDLVTTNVMVQLAGVPQTC